MKLRKMLVSLIVMIIAMIPIGVFAHDVDTNGGWTPEDFTYGEYVLSTNSGNAGSDAVYPGDDYEYMLPGTKYVVTGFSDSGLEKLKSGKTDLVIPSNDTAGRTVQGVGKNAFKANSDPMKSTGKALTSVKFPEGVKTTDNVQDINDKWGTKGYLTNGSVTEIGDFFIGYDAFSYNDIKELDLPDGTIYLGYYAFRANKNMTRVSFPSTLAVADQGAFYQCGIENITFPSETDVRLSLRNMVFPQCKLTEVTLPKDTLKVGSNCFFKNKTNVKMYMESTGTLSSLIVQTGTSGLETIPDTTPKVTFDANGGKVSVGKATATNGKLAAIPTPTWEGPGCKEFEKWTDVATGGTEVDTTTTYTADTTIYAQWKDATISKVDTVLPTAEKDGVKEHYICNVCGKYFSDADGNTEIDAPEVLKWAWEAGDFTYSADGASITGLTASGYEKLDWNTDMALPGTSDTGMTVTSVASNAFQSSANGKADCKKITNVTFADSITTIGNLSFAMCSIENLVLPDTITSIGTAAFQSNYGMKTIKLSKSLTEIPQGCFTTNATTMDPETGVHEVVIPEGVTKIGNSAFNGQHVTTLKLPSTLESIGNLAFQNHQISELEIPASVKTIGTDAFHFTQEGPPKTLEKLTLHEGLTSIGQRAFGGSILKEVEIPDSVTTIHKDAFKARSLTEAQITLCKVSEKSPFYGADAGSCHKFVTEYTITFDADGGSVDPETDKTDVESGKLASIPTPTNTDTCKVFDAWYDENDAKVDTDTVFTKSQAVKAKWNDEHNLTKIDAKDATCDEDGNIEHYTCSKCGKLFSDSEGKTEIQSADTVVKATGHNYGDWTKLDEKQHQRVCTRNSSHIEKEDHKWDAGTVTKEATTTAEGVKTYTCSVCKATKTESIPKKEESKTKKEESKTETKQEVKPVTKTDATPASKPVIVAKGIAAGKKKVNISWNKVKDADRYIVYLGRCNHDGKKIKAKKIATVSGKTYKLKVSKLTANKSYKVRVVAQKKVNGKYKTIATSVYAHFITGNVSGRYTNPKSLKLAKTSATLKKGKSLTIKGTVTKVKKGKKLTTSHAAKLRFISNNPKVAVVSAKGKVTAKSKGTCTVYVQTINGIWKTVKVTVK